MFRIAKIIKKIKHHRTHRRMFCNRPHDVAEAEEKELTDWGEIEETDTEFKKSLWEKWYHS